MTQRNLMIKIVMALFVGLLVVGVQLQAAGYFKVSGFSFPEKGDLGQPLTLKAEITNTGNQYQMQEVIIVVGNSKGDVLNAKRIEMSLDPGQGKVFTESITFTIPGKYIIEVQTRDDAHSTTVVVEEEQQNNQNAEILMASAYVDPISLTSRITAILTDGTMTYMELKGNVDEIERRPTGSSHSTVGESGLTGGQTQFLLDLAEEFGIDIDPRYQVYWGGSGQLTGSERQTVRDVIVDNDFPNLQSSYNKPRSATDRGHLCVRAEKPEGGFKNVCEFGAGSAPSDFAQTLSDGMDHFVNAKMEGFRIPTKYTFGKRSASLAGASTASFDSHEDHDSHAEVASESDMFMMEPLQSSAKTSPNHTSEFLMGSVGVSVILLESDGGVDAQTENWDTTRADKVGAEIEEALTFWADLEDNANLSFTLKQTNGKPYQIIDTGFEPINHTVEDEFLWIDEAMANLGYNTGSFEGVREYAHDLREELDTDWGYVMFVVDSLNDDDGSFAPSTFARTFFAYAYQGGPFMVMTYDNGAWGIERMNQVAAHETGHVFWATDEYTIPQEASGYLNGQEIDDSGQLMDRNTLNLSGGTMEQIGWVDSDNDGIFDILDTEPETTVSNVDENGTITITGSAKVSVVNNQNPRQIPEGTQPEDLTVNTIARVEYSVDGGDFETATPDDGNFDGNEEAFTISLNLDGDHTVEIRAVNSVGNADSTPETVDIGSGSSNSDPSDPDPPGSSSSSSIEKALDTNNNGRLDDDEIKKAIGFWILGQNVPGTDKTIDDNKIKALVTLWISGASIESAAPINVSNGQSLALHATRLFHDSQRLTLNVLGQGIEHIRLQVFDLSGKQVLDEVAGGHQLSIRLDQQRWANGVYLYLVTAEGQQHRVRSEVRKFVLLN